MAITLERYYWEFGDGHVSDLQNPSHTYTSPGEYTVTLTVTDVDGNTSTTQYIITVYDYEYPTATIANEPEYDYEDDDIGILFPELNVGFFDVAATNDCMRFAVKPQHGIGWSFYSGERWIYPAAYVDSLRVYDEQEDPIQLLWDSRLMNAFRADLLDQWLDQESSDDYQPGWEINSEIRFKEDRGSAEHYFLESLEHHVHLRPHNENTRGKEGYTETGYRDAFGVELNMLVDGEQVTPSAKAVNIPITGDITFDRRLVGNRMQLVFKTVGSEYRLVRRRSYYVAADRVSDPKDTQMTESDYQSAMAEPLVWITRGDNLAYDRVSGENASGSYFAAVDGPDGDSSSSAQFNGAEGLSIDCDSLSGDYTLMAWAKNISGNATLFSFGTGGLILRVNGSGQIVFNDGNDTHVYNPNFSAGAWSHIAVTRSGDTVSIYYNGSLFVTVDNPYFGVYGGTVSIGTNEVFDGFDWRVYGSALNAGTIGYYYEDVLNNNGNALLPIY